MTRRESVTLTKLDRAAKVALKRGMFVRLDGDAIELHPLTAAPALPSVDGPTADAIFGIQEQRA